MLHGPITTLEGWAEYAAGGDPDRLRILQARIELAERQVDVTLAELRRVPEVRLTTRQRVEAVPVYQEPAAVRAARMDGRPVRWPFDD